MVNSDNGITFFTVLLQLFNAGIFILVIFFIVIFFRANKRKRKQLDRIEKKIDVMNIQISKDNEE